MKIITIQIGFFLEPILHVIRVEEPPRQTHKTNSSGKSRKGHNRNSSSSRKILN